MMVDAGFNNIERGSSEPEANREHPDFPGNGSRARATADLPDPRTLAEDWIALWQSELTALTADREMRQSWQTIMALWAGTMSAILRGLPPDPAPADRPAPDDRPHGTGGPAGTADAPRTPPAAAAPDARDAEIERLARHVATLEHRLADFERGGDPPVDPKRGPGGKARK